MEIIEKKGSELDLLQLSSNEVIKDRKSMRWNNESDLNISHPDLVQSKKVCLILMLGQSSFGLDA